MDIGTSGSLRGPDEPLSAVSDIPAGPAWLETMHRIYQDSETADPPAKSGMKARLRRFQRGCSAAAGACLRGWEPRSLLPELIGVLGAIGMIWFCAALLLHDEYSDAERHALAETGNLARAFEEIVGQTVSEIDQALLSVRSYYSFLGDRFDMMEWVRTQSRLGSMAAGVHLVDARGDLFASTRALPLVPINVADRDHFKVQRDDPSDRLHISRLVIGRQTGRETIQFTRRLTGPGGVFAGIAVVSFDASELSRFFSTLHLGDGFVALANLDGDVLARGPVAPDAAGKTLADQPYFGEVVSNRAGVVRAGGRGSLDQIISYRKLDGYPLVVLVGDDEASVFGNYWSVRRNAVIVSSIATVVVVLAGAFWIALRRRALASKRALRATLENMSQGIVMVDNDGRIPVINRRAIDLLRLPAKTLSQKHARARVPVSGLVQPAVLRFPFSLPTDIAVSALSDLPPGFDACLDNGSIVEVRTQRLPTGGMVQTFSDVTEQRLAGERLRFIAHHDSVTGLPNRFMLKQRLDAEIARQGADGRLTAVLMIDLDGFKAINDTMGHDAGDQILKSVAARLQDLVRRDDIVARLGGDEFVILQADLPQGHMAETLAQRLISHLSEAATVSGQQVRIGASVGLAVYPLDGDDSETLLKHADIALYRAKTEGRGTFRRFDHWMTRPLQERRALENDLRQAVSASHLDLHFQPQFSSDTLQITGFEALLRWEHAEHGFIPPATFVAVAETCGLIGRIGGWVLDRACREAVGWGTPCRVAVNVSPVQLKDAGFLQVVADVLERTGLRPELLEIEVTEGVLIEEDEQVLGVLRELKSLGVRLTLDDFGTGYSSLSYLLRLPFDKIKIDKSFVQSSDFGARAILEAILGLSGRLNLDVVAEGVETEQQLAMIRRQHCTEIQGFLLAAPMPAREVRAYLRGFVPPQDLGVAGLADAAAT